MIPDYIVPILPPFPMGLKECDVPEYPEATRIVFRLGKCEKIEWPNYSTPDSYVYYCESCREACGDVEKVFRTTASYAEYMKDGPTRRQEWGMCHHAEQHQIIWNWVRGLEKK